MEEGESGFLVESSISERYTHKYTHACIHKMNKAIGKKTALRCWEQKKTLKNNIFRKVEDVSLMSQEYISI